MRRTAMSNQKDKGINPKDIMGSKKASIHLVPPAAIIGIADCMEDGATKYGPFNWREKGKAVQYTTYISAAMRHLLQYLDGEEFAEDSGKNHLAHVMSGIAVLYDAIACGNAVDDRPDKGRASDLIELFSNTKEQK